MRNLAEFICNNKYSYMSPDRLDFLLRMSQENLLPEGAIVECGVCNGGSIACLAYGNNRKVWGFDSWEGCPAPGEFDLGAYEAVHAETGICVGNIDKVNQVIKDLALDRSRFNFVKGWVENTIPRYRQEIGKIAFLHIDCDFYIPTKAVLDLLYDQVSDGGFIFCGDYGYWLGANRAIHEFCIDKPITLERPFKNGVFWKKERWRKV